jgi:hypothetical protein
MCICMYVCVCVYIYIDYNEFCWTYLNKLLYQSVYKQ